MQTAQIALAEHRRPPLIHCRVPLALPRQEAIVCQRPPLPKVEAIIFDMDGVLVNSRMAAAVALASVARQEGMKADRGTIDCALEKGNSAVSIVSCLLPRLNGMPGELDRVARAYTRESLCNAGLIEKTAIAHCLPALSRKFSLAVATNRTKDAALEILDRLGMLTFFGAVMTLADAPAKPDPKMVLLAIMAIGAGIASSVFVGDKPSDRMAGKAAGVRTIMVDGARGKSGCLPFLSEFGNDGARR